MSDILCIYYSRTGNTKKAMEEIAAALDAELVELRDQKSADEQRQREADRRRQQRLCHSLSLSPPGTAPALWYVRGPSGDQAFPDRWSATISRSSMWYFLWSIS